MKALQIGVLVAYMAVIIVNGLANALPINDLTTGEISELYPNLFAPAGFTFSIWGVIYLLLGAYALFQLGLFGGDSASNKIIKRVGVLFIISSMANALWIFSWHHLMIWASLALMAIILASLIMIVSFLHKQGLNRNEHLFIRIPFSVYLGWITVAAIANVTVFLVSIGWDGFGISSHIWAVAIIAVGIIIGGQAIIALNDIAYGAVLVWAYIGILAKHISPAGFDMQYPGIITAASIGIAVFIALIILVFVKKNYWKKL
jgi:hypothetical protein